MSLPLFALERDPIITLEKSDVGQIVDNLPDLDEIPSIESKTTVARRFELPFYSDITLLELTNPTWQPKHSRLCYAEYENKLIRLKGESPPIHMLNANASLKLSRTTVLEYLAFFCFFVRGEEGPFLIIDRLPVGFVPNSSEIEKLVDEYREPTIWGQTPAGHWRTSAMVYYSNAIFLADFTVQLSGMVDMKGDTPILSDLDQRVVAPLGINATLSS